MPLIHETLKKMIATPLFYFIGIGLGLAFTAFFTFFNPGTAFRISAIIFLAVILLSIFVAFMMKDQQNLMELARRMNEEGRHKWALKMLLNARKRVHNEEDSLKIDYEIGSVYYSMEQYRQAVNVLSELSKKCDVKWGWKVYLLLARALCHVKGFFSCEALDAYLSCMECRKRFEEYGREDLEQDIYVCHEISEIYRVKKNPAESNKWFRDEMILRDACCDIGIKNKIKDLSDQAAALAKENHTEDALRKYEEAAHLIENHIGMESARYAVVQAEMGKLFLKGYACPRYDLALECFQKAVGIKRKYMSDMPEELFDSFSRISSDIQELCERSIADIEKSYMEFSRKRNTLNIRDPKDFQTLIGLRDVVLNKCYAVLPLFEEVYAADSLELANLYLLMGDAYKWCPSDYNDCRTSSVYLEKVAKVWQKYKNSKLIQIQLARLLVDLGGTYAMQQDYESALPYRLEALKTIRAVENTDIEDVGKIEMALMKVYKRTKQGETIPYEQFLKNNGLSTVIERFQVRHLGNGWNNLTVKIFGVEKEYNWTLTE